MTEPITRGDKYDIPFKVTGDLTGAATTFRLTLSWGEEIPLEHTVTDPAAGEGIIKDTSGLAIGSYTAELEAVNGEQRVTYPLKGFLVIDPDIG